MTQGTLHPSDSDNMTAGNYLGATAVAMTLSTPIAREIQHAREKYGQENTPQNPDMDERHKLAILVEEVGEVARSLGPLGGRADPQEVLQVAAMAILWYDSLTRMVARPTRKREE